LHVTLYPHSSSHEFLIPTDATHSYHSRFEALMEVKIPIDIFWVVTSCSDVIGYQRLRGPWCFHLQGSMDPLWYPTSSLHEVTTQNRLRLEHCYHVEPFVSFQSRPRPYTLPHTATAGPVTKGGGGITPTVRKLNYQQYLLESILK
jgi:hypothetical protein